MSYQVLARKWRPKNFEQLVGQTHVSQALGYALSQNRLHHAYLFTGTRGVGKTTIARILAKSLNCETNGISAKPCGVCQTCREIDEGRYPDLIEIDAASRTGVDDTRELLDNVPYAPLKGRFKVYLIDEVHMFSKSSFNALLKTLEEPPPHVKFILATTDPQKLPITILSRCLQFHLKNLAESEIVRHLSMVLTQEKIPFEPEALSQIARAAAGSMRDALSLLDQSIAFGQGAVKAEQVAQLLGTIPSVHLHALLQALCQQNPKALRQTLITLETLSPDYAQLVFQLLELLQQIAIIQLGANLSHDVTDATLASIANLAPVELVQLWYQILSDTWQSLPHQPSAKLCVEMGLLRMMAFQPLYPMQEAARAEIVPEAAVSPSALVEMAAPIHQPEPTPVYEPMAAPVHQPDPALTPPSAFSENVALAACVNDVVRWCEAIDGWVKQGLPPDLQSLLENSVVRAYEAGVLHLDVDGKSLMLWNAERAKALCDWLKVVDLHWVEAHHLLTPEKIQQQHEQQTRQQNFNALMNDANVQSALEHLGANLQQIVE